MPCLISISMTYEYAVLCRLEAAMILPSAGKRSWNTAVVAFVAIRHTQRRRPPRFLSRIPPDHEPSMKRF